MPARRKTIAVSTAKRPRRRAAPSRFIPASLDLDDVLRAVVASAADLTGAPAVTVWIADAETRMVRPITSSNAELARELGETPIPYGTAGVGWVAQHRRPLNVRRLADDPRLRWRAWCSERGLTSYLGVPVLFEGELLGVLSLLGRAPFKMGPGERRRLEGFVVQAAAAIRNARHFAASEARRRSAEALAEVGRIVSQGLDPDLVARRIADSVRTLLDVPTAAVYRCDPQTRALTLLAQVCPSDPTFHWEPSFDDGEAVTGLAIRARETVLVADLAVDSRVIYPKRVHARLVQWPYRAVLAVPLLAPDRILGALAVSDKIGRSFTREAIELAELFAAQAVVALENARLYEESRRRQHEAETLTWVARNLTETLDERDVGRRIVESVLPVFAVRSAGLRLARPDGSLVTVARSAAPGVHSELGDVAPVGQGISGRAMALGSAVRTVNLIADPDLVVPAHIHAKAVESGELAILAVPLRAKGRIIGTLTIADREGRRFTDEEATLLQGFADQAALALENARLYGEAARRLRETELLSQIARSVNESLHLDVVLQRVAAAVQELCGADVARIALRDADTSLMTFRYWAGHAPDHWHRIAVQSGKGVGGAVMATGRPARTDHYVGDPRFTQDDAAMTIEQGWGAIMCVPISIGGRIEGLLFASNRGQRTFSEQDEAVLVRLADQAAVSIGNAQLFTGERDARAAAEASEQALSQSEAQLRASEERYRALVEHAPDAIVVFDPRADRFVDVNERAVELSRMTRDALLARSLLDLCPPRQPDGRSSVEVGRAWIKRALRGHTPTFEWTQMDGSGALIPCQVSLVPLPGGARTLIRASLLDVTERARARETQVRLEEELRQAQKMEAIGRLAGGVAHDFNNLLTVIGGRSALISAKLHPNDPVRHDAELVQRTTERAAALTRQLLAFSRKQLMQPKLLSLNTVVGAIEPMLRRLIGEDIEVITALAPDLGVVRADPAQIDQVIMNLAVNARDAMSAGGRLTLSTLRADVAPDLAESAEALPPGPYAVLRVADTGSGMDAATIERIFEPFFTTKAVGKGTGLGLSTVYGIVAQSGGAIGVESEPGRGSVFTIHLPIVTDARESALGPALVAAPVRGRETILLVEDEPDVRALARDILHMHGYRVLETPGPREAERMCRSHAGEIHALLTDVVMPEMSGHALAAVLAALRPAMRVLYMTGYDDEAIGQHGMLDPGLALLGKPFTPAALTAKLRSVLDAPVAAAG